jgi:hypothetical protein
MSFYRKPGSTRVYRRASFGSRFASSLSLLAELLIDPRCGGFVLVVIFNLWLGTKAWNYLLLVWAGKVIAWYWAVTLGLFTGPLSVTAAIVTWILKHTGVI